MGILNCFLSGLYRRLDTLEEKMDQERMALDALMVALTEHFTVVTAGIERILELSTEPDPDVDNSPEIATLAGQIQESTEQIKAVLPKP